MVSSLNSRVDTRPPYLRMRRFDWRLGAILLVAVVMRLPYVETIGHADLTHFDAAWTSAIQKEGLFNIYSNQEDVDYPPLYLLTLSAVAAIHPIDTSVAPAQIDTQLVVLLKIFPLVSELLLLIIAYYWLAERSQLRWFIPIVMAIYPGFLVTTAFWGQTDALLTLLLTLSLIFLNRDRPAWAWGFLGLALIMKFQAIVALPLLLCLSFRRYRFRRTIAGVTICTTLVVFGVLPFIAGSGFENALRPYVGAVDRYPTTTVNAFNLWYLVTPSTWDARPPLLFNNIQDSLLLFGSLTFKNVGLGFFVIYTTLILVAVWRNYNQHREFVWAAALYFGFFMLPTSNS